MEQAVELETLCMVEQQFIKYNKKVNNVSLKNNIYLCLFNLDYNTFQYVVTNDSMQVKVMFAKKKIKTKDKFTF